MRFYIFILLIILVLLTGCTAQKGQVTIPTKQGDDSISTFTPTGDKVCSDDGKPIIRLFATSWCPHCQWVKSTYTKVVRDYQTKGLISAHLWEIDTGDDLLTEEKDPVPGDELALFEHYNARQSIPTFIFGCSYARVGNGYESLNDLAAEEAEFRAVIDKLLASPAS